MKVEPNHHGSKNNQATMRLEKLATDLEKPNQVQFKTCLLLAVNMSQSAQYLCFLRIRGYRQLGIEEVSKGAILTSCIVGTSSESLAWE